MGEYFTLCAQEQELHSVISSLLSGRDKISGRSLHRNVLVVNALRKKMSIISSRLYQIAIEDISNWKLVYSQYE